eukprot:4679865-Prymnesium_polylepis.1
MRYTGCVGKTASGLDSDAACREYWAAMDLPTKVSKFGIYLVEHADWWVVRLGLKGLAYDE